MDLIKVAEQAFLVETSHPEFKAGDTVTVAYRIIEGSKDVFRNIVVMLSKLLDTKVKNVLLFVKFQET